MTLLSCVLARNKKLSENFKGASFDAHYVCTNKLACRKLIKTAGGLDCLPVYGNQQFLPELGVDSSTGKKKTGFFKPISAVASQGVFFVDYYDENGDEIKIRNPCFGE